MKHANEHEPFDEHQARADGATWLNDLRRTSDFHDGDAFAQAVVDRWQADAGVPEVAADGLGEDASPVAGHIGAGYVGTRRAVAIILGWAAMLTLIVLVGRSSWWNGGATVSGPERQPPPQVSLLVDDVNQQYGRHSANFTRVVSQSTDMMNMDRFVDLFMQWRRPVEDDAAAPPPGAARPDPENG